MKVVVIFHRLGPYHVARLAAAARMELTAIELAAETREYAWDVVEAAKSFARVTLFPEGDSRSAGSAEVRRRLQAALDAAQPEAVVVPGWSDTGALAGLEWCGRRGVQAVVMSESTAWDEPRVGWKEWIKRQLVGLCSAGLAGGTPHAEYLAQLGLPRERIFLGYDAVDNDYFTAGATAARAAALLAPRSSLPASPTPTPTSVLRPPSSAPYFLASARFIEKKNLPRLIEAYARYRQLVSPAPLRAGERVAERSGEVFPTPHSDLRPLTSDLCSLSSAPWPLVILGDGPLRADLCHLISDLSLQDFVLLPGFKQYPELPNYYAHAGAFVHASTTEQWGLVVNEAMASGLPVLVSNRCGCAADLVQDGVNGFTFDPLNIEQLAQLMFKISAIGSSSPPRLGRGIQGEVSNSEFQLSTFNLQPSTTLAQMGDASHRIISQWGPERFASGLHAAAACALRVGPVKPTLTQRMLLKALLRR